MNRWEVLEDMTTGENPPQLLAAEKAILDAVTAYAQEHNGLQDGNVITVDGYPGVTVTVTAGADGQPFGLTVEGIVIGDPSNREGNGETVE